MGQGEKKVSTLSFGLWPLSAAAKYLGVSTRQLINYLNNDHVPDKYNDKLRDMGKIVVLPIDEPPAEKVIGPFAYQALKAMICGDFRQAVAYAEQGLQPKPMDWNLGGPFLQNDLQRFFSRLAHGLAWAKNEHASELDFGLPALRRLHREVVSYVRTHKIGLASKDWQAWKYLLAMTTGCALCYFVMHIGNRWFWRSEKQLKRLKAPDYRHRLACLILKDMKRLEQFKRMFGRHHHVTIRVAWNMAQLAALAKCEDTFLQALKALHAKLSSRFDAVKAALEDDDDTRPMLELPRIKDFLEGLDKGKKGPEPDPSPTPA